MSDIDRTITPKLHECIRRSKEIAKEIGHSYAGREHMLLALLDGDGLVQRLLAERGVSKKRVHAEINGEGLDILDSENCPEGFIDSFMWWALRFSPDQERRNAECGAPVILRYTVDDVDADSLLRIKNECQKFWTSVRGLIKRIYGRTWWHPEWNTPKSHADGIGGDFFWVRHNINWHLDNWPFKDRQDFISEAQKFPPIILRLQDGRMRFTEDREWAENQRKMIQEGK